MLGQIKLRDFQGAFVQDTFLGSATGSVSGPDWGLLDRSHWARAVRLSLSLSSNWDCSKLQAAVQTLKLIQSPAKQLEAG